MNIKIGIIGFGCIGTGVVKTLLENKDIIQNRLGNAIEIKKICDLDISHDRGTGINLDVLTNDISKIVDDPEIQIVVELMGGINPAQDFLLQALKQGKHIVTANKKLLAEAGAPLFKKAQEKNLIINFEAAVGGAIPIIRVIKESFSSEKIEEVHGILNGTTNYILTKLENSAVPFEEVLKEAQEAGYAEADPTTDIEGDDAAHKIKLIAQLAFGVNFDFKDIPKTGITQLEQTDFDFAKKMNYKIKLLASTSLINNNFDIRVEPVFLNKNTGLAHVSGVTNAVMFKGNKMKDIILSGPGAGELPTASAVVGDIIDIARVLLTNQISSVPTLGYQSNKIQTLNISNMKEEKNQYYFRATVEDKPGVLAKVCQIFANNTISINAVLQNPTTEKIIPLMMILHKTTSQNLKNAAQEISKLDFVKGEILTIRIADNIQNGV